MSDKLVRIKNRYDTASNWKSNNPVLAAGEIGIDSTYNVMKVGNGSDKWNDLRGLGILSDSNGEYYIDLMYHPCESDCLFDIDDVSHTDRLKFKLNTSVEEYNNIKNIIDTLNELGYFVRRAYIDYGIASESTYIIDGVTFTDCLSYTLIGYGYEDNVGYGYMSFDNDVCTIDLSYTDIHSIYSLNESKNYSSIEEFYLSHGGSSLTNVGDLRIITKSQCDRLRIYLFNPNKNYLETNTGIDYNYTDGFLIRSIPLFSSLDIFDIAKTAIINNQKYHELKGANNYTLSNNASDIILVDSPVNGSTYKIDIQGFYPIFGDILTPRDIFLYSMTDANSEYNQDFHIRTYENSIELIIDNSDIIYADIFGNDGQRVIEITEI